MQSVKFMRRILCRDPILWETVDKLGQFLSTSFSRFGKYVKSGVSVKSGE